MCWYPFLVLFWGIFFISYIYWRASNGPQTTSVGMSDANFYSLGTNDLDRDLCGQTEGEAGTFQSLYILRLWKWFFRVHGCKWSNTILTVIQDVLGLCFLRKKKCIYTFTLAVIFRFRLTFPLQQLEMFGVNKNNELIYSQWLERKKKDPTYQNREGI